MISCLPLTVKSYSTDFGLVTLAIYLAIYLNYFLFTINKKSYKNFERRTTGLSIRPAIKHWRRSFWRLMLRGSVSFKRLAFYKSGIFKFGKNVDRLVLSN